MIKINGKELSPEEKEGFSCFAMMVCCTSPCWLPIVLPMVVMASTSCASALALAVLHENNGTPFLYRSEFEESSRKEERHVHYKATFVWTAAVTWIGVATFLGIYGFNNAVTREETWWRQIDETYRNAAVVVTLGAAVGVASVIASFMYNAISKLQDRALGRGQLPGVSEDSPLFSAPFKPLTQLYALSAFAMIIYYTLNPGSYRDFAASNYADVGSIILASFTVAGIVGATAVVNHKVFSLTHDLAARCAPDFYNFEKGSFLKPADQVEEFSPENTAYEYV